MPDTERPDAHAPAPLAAPADWHAAFRALPAATPPPDGWQRLQVRLPADSPQRRPRWPWAVALAASLLLAVAMPWRLLTPAGKIPNAVANPAATASSPAVAQPAKATATTASHMPRSAPAATSTSSRLAKATRVQPAAADHRQPIRQQTAIRTPAADAATTAITGTLDSLHARSAQLEDLLALARDDRVTSGTAAALTEDLEAQLATVDAALSQPDLSATQRAALWSTRVDALQQLVGIETTQRLYAAHGQSYAAALVTID